jgi:hypothetical protein
MTSDLLSLMREAGCTYLSYGVESGSDKVLRSMNKRLFTVDLASKVLKDTHNSKISTYANIMFGYPTESEADFLDTLSFIKQNRQWIDSVSPSQAFTIILKNTYLYNNPSEFNIGPEPHHLYWKTLDGQNTYPVRFKRYELFCKLCIDLKLTGVGVASEKIDKWQLLGKYYEHEQDYGNAFECYKTDLLQNGCNSHSFKSFAKCAEILKISDEAQTIINIFDLSKKKHTSKDVEDAIDCTSSHTDDNWLCGVARSWAAAVLVANSTQARKDLIIGSRLTFTDGDTRTIIDVREEGNSLIVFLEGMPMDGNIIGHPNKFSIYRPNTTPPNIIGVFNMKSYICMLANKYRAVSIFYRLIKKMRDEIWRPMFKKKH